LQLFSSKTLLLFILLFFKQTAQMQK